MARSLFRIEPPSPETPSSEPLVPGGSSRSVPPRVRVALARGVSEGDSGLFRGAETGGAGGGATGTGGRGGGRDRGRQHGWRQQHGGLGNTGGASGGSSTGGSGNEAGAADDAGPDDAAAGGDARSKRGNPGDMADGTPACLDGRPTTTARPLLSHQRAHAQRARQARRTASG